MQVACLNGCQVRTILSRTFLDPAPPFATPLAIHSWSSKHSPSRWHSSPFSASPPTSLSASSEWTSIVPSISLSLSIPMTASPLPLDRMPSLQCHVCTPLPNCGRWSWTPRRWSTSSSYFYSTTEPVARTNERMPQRFSSVDKSQAKKSPSDWPGLAKPQFRWTKLSQLWREL